MKSNYFISFIFILALCVSQIAVNAHLIGHMHITTDQIDHSNAHFGDHQHADDNHQHANHEESRSDNLNNDCSAFHTYAGMHGIAPVECNNIALRLKRDLVEKLFEVTLVAKSAETKPIRGPPLTS